MIPDHILLALLWIIYCVLHSLLAGRRLKGWLQKKMKNYKWYRLYYTVFSFVSLAALVYFQVRMITVQLFLPNILVLTTGAVLSVSGLVLMLVCIRKYFMGISGLRSLMFNGYSNKLQITGVHRYMRHPLYLGTFAFIWGLLLLLPYLSLLIANIIITVYTLAGIGLEEKKLVSEFGEEYRNYRREVPRLIPFSKPKREL